MEDGRIVELYWERDEQAIAETQTRYGKYCHRIAYNVLHSDEDAEECVNDTYVRAWNSMPPQRPSRLAAFLGRITRNLALDRYLFDRAQKRARSTELILDELEECIPDPVTAPPLAEEIALRDAINAFLASLPQKNRMVFLRRYWYLSPIKEIAADYGMTESNVKVMLHRTRQSFKAYLEKEGIEI